jgi:hypothetical protein
MTKDEHFRQDNSNPHEGPVWSDTSDAAPPSRGRGSGGGLRTYALAAVLILIAIFAFSRSTWAIPPLGFSTRGSCRPAAAGSDGLTAEKNPQINFGGCCSGGNSQSSGDYEEELRQTGLQFYLGTSGDSDEEGLDVSVQDFGCHQEIFIYKDGQLIMRVGYAGGEAYEIPGTP